MNKTAIILTTFLRDDLLEKSVQSFISNYTENCILLIGDQQSSMEKLTKYNTENIKYFSLPYDCGLSFSRNYLVERAKALGAKYCLITADNINFIQSLSGLDPIIRFMESDPDIGMVGLGINYNWQFNLEIINGEFVRLPSNEFKEFEGVKYQKFDLVPNFFLAKIQCLLDCPWDNDLKMEEHLDRAYRLKQTHWKTYKTAIYSGRREDIKPTGYKELRNRSKGEFRQMVQKKYGLTGWIKGMS